MPRANRHYIPGCVWHITHRCHKQEFLLKFKKDRTRWIHWLYQAKKRYGLSVLNYMVTSNHIHLLLVDTNRTVISKSLQLIAGRTAQEYNVRKKRKGAFWEDRYHATAVDTDEHLARCMVYIDLNMVRAGVIIHPSFYQTCGYNEIQNPPQRYSIIDWGRLLDLFGYSEKHTFQNVHRQWIMGKLDKGDSKRDPFWSESIAIGKEKFVERIRKELGGKVQGRKLLSAGPAIALREPSAPYSALFTL